MGAGVLHHSVSHEHLWRASGVSINRGLSFLSISAIWSGGEGFPSFPCLPQFMLCDWNRYSTLWKDEVNQLDCHSLCRSPAHRYVCVNQPDQDHRLQLYFVTVKQELPFWLSFSESQEYWRVEWKIPVVRRGKKGGEKSNLKRKRRDKRDKWRNLYGLSTATTYWEPTVCAVLWTHWGDTDA